MISKSIEERFLGIDYGEKRIGIAITDPLQIFSYPLKTLRNDQKFWNEFKKILDEFNVVKLVLGYPLKENGKKSLVSELVLKFKNELEKRYNIPIVLIDERYSSEIAQQQIIESVVSKKKRRDKGLIDKTAAAIILKDYLESLS